MLVFECPRGECFSAILAEIELNRFMLGLAAAALDEMAALAIGATLDLAVEGAVGAAPKYVEFGF